VPWEQEPREEGRVDGTDGVAQSQNESGNEEGLRRNPFNR